MNYNIYFSPVTEALDDGEPYFESNGQRYYHKIEICEDMIRIYDTCGRVMPLDKSSIDGLDRAVFIMKSMENLDEMVKDYFEEILFLANRND